MGWFCPLTSCLFQNTLFITFTMAGSMRKHLWEYIVIFNYLFLKWSQCFTVFSHWLCRNASVLKWGLQISDDEKCEKTHLKFLKLHWIPTTQSYTLCCFSKYPFEKNQFSKKAALLSVVNFNWRHQDKYKKKKKNLGK